MVQTATKKAATGKRRDPEHGTAGIVSICHPARPACHPGRAIAIAMSKEIELPAQKSTRAFPDQELVHAFGQAAVQIVEWIRRADAAPGTKLANLARVADAADILKARLQAEVFAAESSLGES